MLAFSKKKVVKRKVIINVPEDGDAFTKAEIRVTWELVPRDSKSLVSYDADFFQRVISNVEDVTDADTKEPITCTPEWLAGFLAHDYVVAGLQREYINCTVAAGRGN